jgi:RNA polymerase sigma-70 factor (ECF subfamily)
MADQRMLARRFDAQRPRLVAVARRLLGSTVEAEDVVQDAWLRLQRVDPDQLDNVDAWLTTVVSRLSLDELRSARHTKERAWAVTKWSDAASTSRGDPEVEATQNDRISVALLTVLELLSPAERLAFVLHDVFGLSFDEVARMLNRSADASRQLASRARRRLRNGDATIRPDGRRARPIVAAWLAAVQDGDFDALLGLLDDGAVLRADYGTHGQQLRGARQIAENAVVAQALAAHSVPVLIDGDPGVAVVIRDSVVTLMAFEIRHGRIVGLDVLADPARIAELRITAHSAQVDPA